MLRWHGGSALLRLADQFGALCISFAMMMIIIFIRNVIDEQKQPRAVKLCPGGIPASLSLVASVLKLNKLIVTREMPINHLSFRFLHFQIQPCGGGAEGGGTGEEEVEEEKRKVRMLRGFLRLDFLIRRPPSLCF